MRIILMKSKEELSALKEEVEALKKKLSELTEEELKLVSGGGPSSTEEYWCTDTNCPYPDSSKCPKYFEKSWLLCPKK